MVYRGQHRNRIAPTTRAGNVYYVRLKTDVGILYKIGFTTFSSVEERFAFKGDGGEALIHKTLLAVRLEDAYDVEQRLHELLWDQRLFGRYSRNPYMPLFENGQSELYARDVLKLDDEFTEAQEIEARQRIKRRYGEEQLPLAPQYQVAKMVATAIGATVAYGLVIPISKIFFRAHERKAREEREREEAKRLREQAKRLHRVEETVTMLREEQRRQQGGMLGRG